MKIAPISVKTETEFFAFQGGLNIVSPALRLPAGAVIASQNYEPAIEGGYSRCKGYERFDGRPSPSAAPSGLSGAITPTEEAQGLVDAADVRRALITAPTGSGPVRGVCYYAGSTYAFRDNAGGTAGAMWKSSAGGWVAVALNEEVAFTNANVSVGDGDTLTQGGVTAAVNCVVVETGSLASGVNTGRLIISTRLGGNFAAGAATSTGGGTLTLSGVQTAITLPPGGRYQFDIANFFGQATSIRMYGCNGVGKAFEFDGLTFVPLNTGATTDTPKFIKAHRKYLFVAQGSSAMNSSIGTPYRWVSAEGAAENPVGDTITGFAALAGEALGILARNSSFALTGASPATWSLQNIRPDVGAVPYTVANMSDVYFLDDRGVTSVRSAQEYGNFQDATLSRKIQPLIDRIRSLVVGSYVVRQRGLYVLMMSDGSTLTMGATNGQVAGFLEGVLPIVPSCMWSGEDENGLERVFVGANDGYVYEMDKGSTFDGAAIEAALKLYYYNSKSPRVRKKYRKMILEMSAILYAEIRFAAEYSYGSTQVGQLASSTFSVNGSGGSWDATLWDSFVWDAQDINQPELPMDGTGINVSLTFYSNTKLDFGHTLQGAILHYTPRRLQR